MKRTGAWTKILIFSWCHFQSHSLNENNWISVTISPMCVIIFHWLKCLISIGLEYSFSVTTICRRYFQAQDEIIFRFEVHWTFFGPNQRPIIWFELWLSDCYALAITGTNVEQNVWFCMQATMSLLDDVLCDVSTDRNVKQRPQKEHKKKSVHIMIRQKKTTCATEDWHSSHQRFVNFKVNISVFLVSAVTADGLAR